MSRNKRMCFKPKISCQNCHKLKFLSLGSNAGHVLNPYRKSHLPAHSTDKKLLKKIKFLRTVTFPDVYLYGTADIDEAYIIFVN